jgi:hypothetical protein
MQVGVRVPSSEPGFFSIAEVQRLTIPYRQIQHRQVLSVKFRPPADAAIEVILKVPTAAPGGAVAEEEAEGSRGAAEPSAAAGVLSGTLARLNDPRLGGLCLQSMQSASMCDYLSVCLASVLLAVQQQRSTSNHSGGIAVVSSCLSCFLPPTPLLLLLLQVST